MLRNRNLAHTLTAMLGEIWINHCKPHTEVQTRPRFSVAFSTLTTCANSRVPPCSAGPLAVLGVDAGPRRMVALSGCQQQTLLMLLGDISPSPREASLPSSPGRSPLSSPPPFSLKLRPTPALSPSSSASSPRSWPQQGPHPRGP